METRRPAAEERTMTKYYVKESYLPSWERTGVVVTADGRYLRRYRSAKDHSIVRAKTDPKWYQDRMNSVAVAQLGYRVLEGGGA